MFMLRLQSITITLNIIESPAAIRRRPFFQAPADVTTTERWPGGVYYSFSPLPETSQRMGIRRLAIIRLHHLVRHRRHLSFKRLIGTFLVTQAPASGPGAA
jgi:hypothetical protein